MMNEQFFRRHTAILRPALMLAAGTVLCGPACMTSEVDGSDPFALRAAVEPEPVFGDSSDSSDSSEVEPPSEFDSVGDGDGKETAGGDKGDGADGSDELPPCRGEVGPEGECISLCGNGVIDAGEECDGADLGGQECESVLPNPTLPWLAGGPLGCTSSCTFDTSACYECGNGVLDPTEQCDGSDFGGLTCADLHPTRILGTPVCDEFCQLHAETGCCIPTGDSCSPGLNDICCGGGPFACDSYSWPMVCL